MKQKEKAKELYDKHYQYVADGGHPEYLAKQCTLISVDEIIKETKLHDLTIYQHGRTVYWEEVKQEIQKL